MINRTEGLDEEMIENESNRRLKDKGVNKEINEFKK